MRIRSIDISEVCTHRHRLYIFVGRSTDRDCNRSIIGTRDGDRHILSIGCSLIIGNRDREDRSDNISFAKEVNRRFGDRVIPVKVA